MSLKLADHLFTGPFDLEKTEVRANQPPVVYAVIAKGGQAWAPVFRVIDIGASPDAGLHFAAHPRCSDWRAEGGEAVGIYLFYAPRSKFTSADRERIAGELRARYDPPRGLVA